MSLRLSDAERARVAAAFDRVGVSYEPHALAAKTGISTNVAGAILLLLAHRGLGRLYLEIFHCQPIPVRRRPFSRGFQTKPMWCRECETIVDPSELRYQLEYRHLRRGSPV